MSCLSFTESHKAVFESTEHLSRISLIVSADPLALAECPSCFSLDCSRCAPDGFTECLLELLESQRSTNFPARSRGRVPFVSKAMAWLRLSDRLIVDNDDTPIVITGFGLASETTQREIFRLLRFYLAHKPHRGLVLYLAPEEVSLLPEELRNYIE